MPEARVGVGSGALGPHHPHGGSWLKSSLVPGEAAIPYTVALGVMLPITCHGWRGPQTPCQQLPTGRDTSAYEKKAKSYFLPV